MYCWGSGTILPENSQAKEGLRTPLVRITFWCQISVTAVLLPLPAFAQAQTVFSDDFSSGASPLWGNESGAWSAAGGVYRPSIPQNLPAALSFLPFTMTDFALDVDIGKVMDGGVWLRSSPAPGNSLGIKGVLLNLKIPDGGPKIYWHIVEDGTAYGIPLNVNYGSFPVEGVVHLHIEVSGNTYSAFVNGSSNPATALTTRSFSSGRVALYDFSRQSFDNFVLRGQLQRSNETELGARISDRNRLTSSALATSSATPETHVTEAPTPSVAGERPTLSLEEGVILSWPADFTGYVLEENDSLIATNWVRVTNSVRAANHVVVPTPSGNRFYRLSAP